MSDIEIRSGDITLAARDHGGQGPAVILLHGAGGNLLGWGDFPENLTSAHRVISFDLRGHGRSGDGEFTVDSACQDISAVIAHFGLDSPALVGHSLGGILAIAYGARHDCRAVVSLDGHRSAATHPANYAGMSPETLESDLAALNAFFDTVERSIGDPVSEADLERVIAAAAAQRPDRDAERLGAQLRRSFESTPDGWCPRPRGETLGLLRRLDAFVDAVPLLADNRGPVLMLLATRPMAGVPERFAALTQAHREGLFRDLAEVGGHVTVTKVDTSHDLIQEAGSEVASEVLSYLDKLSE